MARTNQQYLADIRHAIRDFYCPGDCLQLIRQYRQSRKCEMCGGIVDIVNCYDLRNTRTGKVIVCGEVCIGRYAEFVSEMGQTPLIVFPQRYRQKAEVINQHRPHTVTLDTSPGSEFSGESWNLDVDDSEYEDSIAEGLDPDEVDWESHDYE